MEFTDINIIVRSSVNGAMALSAMMLMVIFGQYVWLNRRDFGSNITAQAAAAILLLITGHFFRAISTWTEFTLVALGQNTQYWLERTWVWFLLAVAMILLGKALMLYAFVSARWRWRLIGIGLPLCLLAPLVFVLMLLGIDQRPPYLVPEARALTSEVEVGGRLRIGFHIIRRRACQFELVRFIAPDDGSTEPVWQENVAGGLGPVGDDWVILDVQVPNLPPGRYLYQTRIINLCKERTFTTETPKVPFTIK